MLPAASDDGERLSDIEITDQVMSFFYAGVKTPPPWHEHCTTWPSILISKPDCTPRSTPSYPRANPPPSACCPIHRGVLHGRLLPRQLVYVGVLAAGAFAADTASSSAAIRSRTRPGFSGSGASGRGFSSRLASMICSMASVLVP